MTVTWLIRKDDSDAKRPVAGMIPGIMKPMEKGESFGVKLDGGDDRRDALKAIMSSAAKLSLGVEVRGAEGYDFVVEAV
jgi:hypothetical protein